MNNLQEFVHEVTFPASFSTMADLEKEEKG